MPPRAREHTHATWNTTARDSPRAVHRGGKIHQNARIPQRRTDARRPGRNTSRSLLSESYRTYNSLQRTPPLRSSARMNFSPTAEQATSNTGRYRLFRLTAILLLLLTVPGLSTLAKHSWYLPASNPTHFLTAASKMRVVRPTALPDRSSLQAIAVAVLPQPPVPIVYCVAPESAPPRSGVPVSPQLRSPPVSLA